MTRPCYARCTSHALRSLGVILIPFRFAPQYESQYLSKRGCLLEPLYISCHLMFGSACFLTSVLGTSGAGRVFVGGSGPLHCRGSAAPDFTRQNPVASLRSGHSECLWALPQSPGCKAKAGNERAPCIPSPRP